MPFEPLDDVVDDLTDDALDAQFEEAMAREERHDQAAENAGKEA